MPYKAPIALLSDLKSRMNISQDDTTEDDVLLGILLGVSDAIETIASRPLRRQHVRKQRFAGGVEAIKLDSFPIAGIHWIRESPTRIFNDPDEYTELVDGTDYVLDGGNGEPGQYGWVRKIDGTFLGRRGEPGLIEVCYTGGFKTPDEAAIENSTVSFNTTTNSALIDAFSVAKRYVSGTLDGYLAQFMAADTAKAGNEFSSSVDRINRAFIHFQFGNSFIPTWEIVEATLAIYMNRSDGSSATSCDAFIFPHNAKAYLNRLSDLYDLATDITDGKIASNISHSSSTFTLQTFTMHSDAAMLAGENMEILNEAAKTGALSFMLRQDAETLSTALASGICTPRHATSGQRPTLSLVCRDTLYDPYGMPEDLKHAALLQAANDYQMRRNAGFRQETQRGVSISSGISYTRDPITMLPLVRQVAERYAL